MNISKESFRTIPSFETEPVSSEGKSYHVHYGLAMASLSGETSSFGIQTLGNLTTTPPFRFLKAYSQASFSHCPTSVCLPKRKQAGPCPDPGGKTGLH